ncbi:hypothetical protein [Diaphorobacter sp.]|uniref:hypothetical protein n=1 Tax=Diaphorobacter sp. TaxID=1934310 RepID=UPI0028AA30B7|nr:hypothetical protein [Diaphorobacter sp.]
MEIDSTICALRVSDQTATGHCCYEMSSCCECLRVREAGEMSPDISGIGIGATMTTQVAVDFRGMTPLGLLDHGS